MPSGTCGLLREAERCEEERRTASRGREHLVDSERSERIYLVIRDRMRGKLWVLLILRGPRGLEKLLSQFGSVANQSGQKIYWSCKQAFLNCTQKQYKSKLLHSFSLVQVMTETPRARMWEA